MKNLCDVYFLFPAVWRLQRTDHWADGYLFLGKVTEHREVDD